jgi:hypothetical protein
MLNVSIHTNVIVDEYHQYSVNCQHLSDLSCSFCSSETVRLNRIFCFRLTNVTHHCSLLKLTVKIVINKRNELCNWVSAVEIEDNYRGVVTGKLLHESINQYNTVMKKLLKYERPFAFIKTYRDKLCWLTIFS